MSFLSLESNELDHWIYNTLQALGETMGADRGYVYLLFNTPGRAKKTHEWLAQGFQPRMDPPPSFRVEQFPWIVGQLEKKEIVSVSRLTEFPAEAGIDKALFQSVGCQSIILVPMVSENISLGFLSFESFRKERTWPDEMVGLLKMVGEIFINSLENGRMGRIAEKSNGKYRDLVENINDVIFSLDIHGCFTYVSPVIEQWVVYKADELSGQPFTRLLHPKDLPEFLNCLGRVLAGMTETHEFRILGANGGIRHVRVSCRRLSEGGHLKGLTGLMSDITERKKEEEQIRFLGFHDQLTGLYNRHYFEEELKRLDTERQLPLSLILGDVNGLKLVNDVFGHQEGDKILTGISAALRESCRKEDLIARLGGDEFAILLPATNSRTAMDIAGRIKTACSQAGTARMPLSIALGAATKESPSQNLKELMKIAEERMYRDKLEENKSLQVSMVSSLHRDLLAMNDETEEHIRRMQELAVAMGRAVGLAGKQLDDLELLSALHDIGKIAVPEKILRKPAALSPEEREVIGKHPEIGYRIATSIPELASIADAILTHHEWWDGNGYPRKLKGEEIPLVSRILAVVDCFDALTRGRPYRKAVSREEALAELQEKAGGQFDPALIPVFMKIVVAA